MTEERGAFKGPLSLAHRGFAIELRDTGNRWAHGEAFADADADRALDTIERLLTAVGAIEQASQVRRIRAEPSAPAITPDTPPPARRTTVPAGTSQPPVPPQSPGRVPRLVRTLVGHAAAVRGVAFSPDGGLLATASNDRTARLWDPATGQHLRTLTGHGGSVLAVAFCLGRRLLATSSRDMTVRLWDPATGRHLRAVAGHNEWVFGVAFSPDGQLLATIGAADDNTVRLWDPVTGEHLQTLIGHSDGVLGVAFNPVGLQLATASDDMTARLWASDQYAGVLTGHTDRIRGVAFSPDGRLAAAGVDTTVLLWDPATGQHHSAQTGHNGAIWSVAFSPDGQLLATASADYTVQLWDFPASS